MATTSPGKGWRPGENVVLQLPRCQIWENLKVISGKPESQVALRIAKNVVILLRSDITVHASLIFNCFSPSATCCGGTQDRLLTRCHSRRPGKHNLHRFVLLC